MKKVCGMNGFGRFGIHFLRYYLKNLNKNKFVLKYINDPKLSFEKIKEIIRNDQYVKLQNFDLKFKKDSIIFYASSKNKLEIIFTNDKINKISWHPLIDYYLECSGEKLNKINFLINKYKNINNLILSATSHEASKTLIYGFNHKEYNKKYKTISYGSCTVNAFVPIANSIDKNYKIKDCDVNVIHNLPEYKINENTNNLERRFCTLSSSGPKLLKFLNKKNFNVNYTLVPYTGPSMMDIRFKISKKPKSLDNVVTKIKNNLKKIYDFDKKDKNSNEYKFIETNLNIILSNSSLKNNNIYLSGYFDNENSVVRFNDIINYIVMQNLKNVKKM